MPLRGFPPFQDLSDGESALRVDMWNLRGQPVGEGSVVPAWGYDTSLEFVRRVTLHASEVLATTEIGTGATVRVVATWSAASALKIGAIACDVEVTLREGESPEVTLNANVPSPHLAETLRLTTAVLLQARGIGTGSIAASLPGSVLWRDHVSLTLEGAGARLPVQATDFSRFPSSETGAVWCVWTGPEWLYRHPTVGIIVYLNSKHPVAVSALTSRNPDTLQRALQSVMFHEVGRFLFEAALDDDDFSDEAEFPRASAGDSLRSSLRAVFRHQTISQIREMRRHDPAAFDRSLQTRHKLLKELG